MTLPKKKKTEESKEKEEEVKRKYYFLMFFTTVIMECASRKTSPRINLKIFSSRNGEVTCIFCLIISKLFLQIM